MIKQYGIFTLEIWGDGYPVQIRIKQGQEELRLIHSDLADLEHLVNIAKREAVNALPDKYKKEV